MPDPVHITIRGRRLKGLDEFEAPEFVGRMARVAQRRRMLWTATVVGAITVGAVFGWTVA